MKYRRVMIDITATPTVKDAPRIRSDEVIEVQTSYPFGELDQLRLIDQWNSQSAASCAYSGYLFQYSLAR